MPLLAGTAAIDVTPPLGIKLAGFASRDHGAEALHDPLYSKALVLDDGHTRLCLITNDLIAFRAELVDLIRGHIHEATGILPENILLSCSHTHSGPQVGDDDFRFVLAKQVAGAARVAAANLRPARLGSARGPVQVGINRREMRDGQMVLGRNPDGPVAPWVDVVRVDDEAGNPLSILFAHSCHPVTRASDSYFISADYPGQAQALVQLVHPGAVAMFAQGCSGNINSEPVGGSFEDVRRLGTMLAGEVLKVRELAQTTDDLRLAVAHEMVHLPCQEIPDLDQIDAELASCEEQLAAYEAAGNTYQVNMQRAFRDTWAKLRDLKLRGEELPPYDFPLHGFAFGDIAILGLPGEVFVEYQLHAEAVSPFRQTLTLGCTNAVGTYVPTAAALDQGGYEVSFTPLWWGRLPFAPELERNLQQGLENLLTSLRKSVETAP